MRTVYKYPLQKTPDNLLDLECEGMDGPVVLCDFQPRVGLCVWIEGESLHPVHLRRFMIFGTGHALPPDYEAHHVHSWIDGPFVWHLYEVWPS